jgi:Arc/MetJ-type ribon-helix-helix transcriptional regulator
MQIRPTRDQQAFIHAAIEAGRIDSAEDAAREAMKLWEERERRRSEILASIDAAEASIARGEGIEITEESMRALAEDVKQRGRARLMAERKDIST